MRAILWHAAGLTAETLLLVFGLVLGGYSAALILFGDVAEADQLRVLSWLTLDIAVAVYGGWALASRRR